MISMKRFLPILVIIVLLIIIKNNISAILNTVDNTNSTKTLQKTLSNAQKENEYLKQKLFYVKTDQFVADQAQNKLGMVKPGEYFVIAPTPPTGMPEQQKIDSRANWQKWLELFF